MAEPAVQFRADLGVVGFNSVVINFYRHRICKNTWGFHVIFAIVILLIIGIIVLAYLKTEKTTTVDGRVVRLPDTIIPLYYKIDLIPHLEDEKSSKLEGKVWIDVKCLKPTSTITMHIRDLKVKLDKVRVIPTEKAELPVKRSFNEDAVVPIVGHDFDKSKEKEFYVITLGSMGLEVGKFYRIYIEYTGTMDENPEGFYIKSYSDEKTKEKRYVALTRFLPIYARKAFPCFDEPALKAKFEISLAVKSDMIALSNMNRVARKSFPERKGWAWEHFNKSLPMSTFLVNFVVSPFGSKAAKKVDGAPEVKLWARGDILEQETTLVEFALKTTPKILSFFGDYFGIEYPLDKLDLVAIPDHVTVTTQSWGLLPFRESAMLDDPSDSEWTKLEFLRILSYMLVTQWFTNLVSPKWWSDAWIVGDLNTYLGFVAANDEHSIWDMRDVMADLMFHVLDLDTNSNNSHPMSIPIRHPEDITRIYKEFVFIKGACIIRMMQYFLTENNFKSGLQQFLKKGSYDAVGPNDLWSAMEEQAHRSGALERSISVQNIMDTWTLQQGYPLIEVHRNYADKSAKFIQTRFKNIKDTKKSSERWWVPLSYASLNENTNFGKTQPSFWLSKDDFSIIKSINANESSWLVVNVQQTGYYRVNYDPKNWELIITQLFINPSAIHVLNRAQLLDDAFSIAQHGQLDYSLVLVLTKYLKNETEYLPWLMGLTNLEYVAKKLLASDLKEKFKSYGRSLIEMEYKRHNAWSWSFNISIPIHQPHHSEQIINWGFQMDHKDCVKLAKMYFEKWMNYMDPETEKANTVPPNLRRSVYCSAIKEGGIGEWNFLWERYLKSSDSFHKKDILKALTCSKNSTILDRYLEMVSSNETRVSKVDGSMILEALILEQIGSPYAFTLLRESWKRLKAFFGTDFPKIFDLVVDTLNSKRDLTLLKEFRDQFSKDLSDVNFVRAFQTVQESIDWMDRNYETIRTWMESQKMS